MKKLTLFFLLSILAFTLMPQTALAREDSAYPVQPGGSTKCPGTVIDLGITKRLLPFGELMRPGQCGSKPNKIIIHTTEGQEYADDLWTYFATHPEGRYASTQFTVGKDGKALQMLETLSDKAEIGWAVAGYNGNSVSIEVGYRGDYNSKAEAPAAQYQSLLDLVRKLMGAYDIPVGDIEYTTSNNSDTQSDGTIKLETSGIFGHYQLSPNSRQDPGEGFLKDVRDDVKKLGPITASGSGSITVGGGSTSFTACALTKVGDPKDPAPVLPPECNKGNGSSSGRGLPAGPCQAAPPLPTDVKQAIIDKWGITLNLPQDQINSAWGEFYQIDCTGFLQDIKGTTIGSWGNAYAQQFSCPADGGTNIQFSDQWSGRFMQTIIVHEMTHVWQNCSSKGEQNKLDNDVAFESEGGLTMYSRTGCSFNVDLSKEDHADTIALYLNPDQGELTCGGGAPNPFSTGNYPKHKASAEKGVGKLQ